MPSTETIRALMAQASASGSRSTALQPLGWLVGILTSGLILAPTWSPPEWLLISMACLLGITVVIYLVSYIYLGIKNPDALRSEKFTLSKMAIEKNLIGDNQSGLLELDEFGDRDITPSFPEIKGDKK